MMVTAPNEARHLSVPRKKTWFETKVDNVIEVWDHSSITSAKRWVGGVRKWQFLLIYSAIYADVVGWVGLKKPKAC